jgi:electron transfer flavoprotein alpha subunit
MAGTLVVAEHFRGVLKDVTAELVTAAGELGGPVAVAVIGPDLAVDLAGVDGVIHVPGPQSFDADSWQAAVGALIDQGSPDHVICAHSVDGMAWAAGLAASRGLGFASDVVAVRDGGVRRELYQGKVVADLAFDGPAILTIRPTSFAAAADGGSPPRSTAEVSLPSPRIRHRGYVEQPPSDVDITVADVLVSIGRGVGDRENIEMFEQLAAKLGATLSSSRPLVDAGWMDHARQVGQSGTTVKPSVYLAFGISGAVQHLAGMKGARTIIAVNTDSEAPIFSVAHYGAVADCLDVAEALLEG